MCQTVSVGGNKPVMGIKIVDRQVTEAISSTLSFLSLTTSICLTGILFFMFIHTLTSLTPCLTSTYWYVQVVNSNWLHLIIICTPTVNIFTVSAKSSWLSNSWLPEQRRPPFPEIAGDGSYFSWMSPCILTVSSAMPLPMYYPFLVF